MYTCKVSASIRLYLYFRLISKKTTKIFGGMEINYYLCSREQVVNSKPFTKVDKIS